MKRIEHPTTRFWRKVEVSDGCWLWLGGLFESGYGRFSQEPWLSVRAHRYAWEITYGPIPEGLIVCHHCDTPRCVKPAHLFLGTHKDNAEDRDRKGRAAWLKGEWNPAAKITQAVAVAARRLRTEGLLLREIGENLGISERHAGQITRGEIWRHVR